jgi:hypothetical protein
LVDGGAGEVDDVEVRLCKMPRALDVSLDCHLFSYLEFRISPRTMSPIVGMIRFLEATLAQGFHDSNAVTFRGA